MAGLVRAAAGASLDEVEREARESLESKRGQLGDPADAPEPAPTTGELTLDVRLRNPSGLHIRPASMIVLALTPLDATVTIANLRTGSGPRMANSPTKLLTLAAQKGDIVRVAASGPEAQAALDLVRTMVTDGFGELEAPALPLPAGGPTRSGPLGVSPGRAVGPVVRMPEALAAPIASAPLPSRIARPRRRASGSPLPTLRTAFGRGRSASRESPATFSRRPPCSRSIPRPWRRPRGRPGPRRSPRVRGVDDARRSCAHLCRPGWAHGRTGRRPRGHPQSHRGAAPGPRSARRSRSSGTVRVGCAGSCTGRHRAARSRPLRRYHHARRRPDLAHRHPVPRTRAARDRLRRERARSRGWNGRAGRRHRRKPDHQSD